jgi:glycosyltransferase involved in cell wall biosynthesis
MHLRAAIITIYDPYLYRGGIERYTLNLVSLLETKGIEVTIYHAGLPVAGENLIEKIYSVGRQLYAEQHRYDFIISNSFYGMGYFPSSVKSANIYHSTHAGFIEKHKNKNEHNPYFYFQFFREELGEYVSGYNRKKIAVSDLVKEELETIYGFSDIKVVYSGVDIAIFKRMEDRERIRGKLGIPEDAVVGLFVGRWENEKDRNHIMRNMISQRNDICWLLVLASGGMKYELSEGTNILIKKDVPYDEMPLMYASADFMLFPSTYEGFGLAIIEAMACGLPVITANVGIATTIYRDEPFNILLLPDMDEHCEGEIALVNEKIRLLKGDSNLRKQISDFGIEVVRENYNLDMWRKNMVKALEL